MSAEDALEGLRDGKSEVICDQGQLVKISKDKKGVVTGEILTKNWTDWVDYWAVDFDYMSRKEIIRLPRDPEARAQAAAVLALEPKVEYEEVETGGYIFEPEWQSFRRSCLGCSTGRGAQGCRHPWLGRSCWRPSRRSSRCRIGSLGTLI